MSHWASKYIGIPFLDRGRTAAGCDCWGLLCLVLRHERGVDVSGYDAAYTGASDASAADAIRSTDDEYRRWTQVLPGDERPFDAVLMTGCYRNGSGLVRAPMHVGVVVSPSSATMLHVEAGTDACISRYRRNLLIERRVVAMYRHAE